MLKLRSPNNTQLANSRLADFMRRMRESLRADGNANLTDLSKTISKGFGRFFLFSGQPQIDLEETQLHKFQLPSFRRWNDMMESIDADIKTAYDELNSLGQLSISIHNYGQVLTSQLRDKAAEAASKVIDIRLQSGQLDTQLIIAGDDFSDLSKIDQDFQLQNPMAEIITDQGVITLSRIEAINVFEGANLTIDVKTLNTGITTNPTPGNTDRFYEGNFFDHSGQSRPEGGKFHLEEKIKPGVVRSGDGEIKVVELESNSFFKNAGDLRNGNNLPSDNNPISPNDIQIIDRGASPEEKQTSRLKMVDSNPNTFWECEVVRVARELDFIARGSPVDITTEVGGSAATSPELSKKKKGATSGNKKDVKGYSVNIEPNPAYDPATPERLRALAASTEIDTFDLEVEFIIKLSRPQFINFLTFNPYNFDEAAWLEIFEVSTSSDQSSAFELIEGFENNQFQNTLTDEANEELDANEAKNVLSPDRYAYRGQGIWTFPVRTVTRIKFKIRQKTPVPNPYQTLVVQLRRQLIRTTA